MPTSLINNFKINFSGPIDTRMTATNSSDRDSITYKYDGMRVFQIDNRTIYTYNTTTATWSYDTSGNGIYGGSGSLVNNTYVNVGTISNSVSGKSYLLGYNSIIGSNNVYLNTNLLRNTAGSTWDGVSFRIQHTVDTTNKAYVEFNPDYSETGGFAIGTNNTEKFRINGSGKTGILMTAYGQASFMVNGIISGEGIYISYDNSNTTTTGGGYVINVDNSGNFKIRDTSPDSADYKANLLSTSTPGYAVLNIKDGKFLIGGTTSAVVTSAESRLEIYDASTLGTSTGNNLILKTLTHNPDAGSNVIRVREFALRDKTYYSTNDWYSWRYHNGISIDASYGTPSSTRCFWERDPATERQWFGSSGIKTLEIDSINNYMLLSNSSGLNFGFKNKQQIFYIDSNNYIIIGSEQVEQNSSVSYAGGNGFIKDITIPNDCTINVEVIYNSSQYISNSLVGSPTRYIYQNKISYGFKVNSSGTITTISSNSYYTFYDASYLSAGTVETTTNTIRFRQLWTDSGISGYTTYAKLKTFYKVFISAF